jgi:tRNA threonylcarbamoyladenosine biosynthesis protein TsaB
MTNTLILYIETSTDLCSVALSEGAKNIYSFVSDKKNEHSSTLSVYIENALQSCGKQYKDLSAVAVGLGPGSYTGLRIGVSAAKGLCYALGIPAIGISPLQAMTSHILNLRALLLRDEVAPARLPLEFLEQPLNGNPLFIPMLDAGRMEVYTAVYDKDMKEVMPIQALVLEQDSFTDLAASNTLVFFGSGSNKFRDIMPNAEFIDNIVPTAEMMIPLAFKAYFNSDFLDTAYFEPVYIKEFIAKAPVVKGLPKVGIG